MQQMETDKVNNNFELKAKELLCGPREIEIKLSFTLGLFEVDRMEMLWSGTVIKHVVQKVHIFYIEILKVVLYFLISSTVNMRVKESIVLLINTRLEFSLAIKCDYFFLLVQFKAITNIQ